MVRAYVLIERSDFEHRPGDIVSLHATEIAVISSGLMGHMTPMQSITLAYEVSVDVVIEKPL